MKRKPKRIRPVGDIMLDMEKLLDELSIQHDMQHHEVIGLIDVHLKVHNPEQIAEYLDGSNPVPYLNKGKTK